jgi:Fe-S cluster assembly ATP-binding protein
MGGTSAASVASSWTTPSPDLSPFKGERPSVSCGTKFSAEFPSSGNERRHQHGLPPLLTISNLHVAVAGTPILKGLSLDVPKGEVHAIMGPNGAGKSTLSYTLAGRDGYEVTEGAASLDGEDLLALQAHERAAKGVFLSFQYPLEIPGVPALTFVRTALNAQKKARGEDEVSAPEFLKRAKQAAAALKMDFDMLRRGLNVGFSGGEKKRMEIFQMAMLEPRLLILDETDSGLDIDALRIVSEGVNALRSPERSMLVITHYQRLLDYIRPDKVHVLAGGRIVASGGPELALELEREGYDKYVREAA